MKRTTVRIVRVILSVIAAALAVGLALLGVHLYAPESRVEWLVVFGLVAVLGWIFSGFLHPLFHEIGHLLLGKTVGMKLILLQVSRCKVTRQGKLRFSLDQRALGGGQCVMLPAKFTKLRFRLFLHALGGILGSLLYLVLSLLALKFAPAVPFYLFAFFGIGAVNGVYQLFSNMIPSEGAEPTDGSVLYGYLNRTPSSKVGIAVTRSQGKMLLGAAPSEILPELEDLPVLCEDDVNFIAAENLRYLAALDAGDREKMRLHATRLLVLTDYLTEEAALSLQAELLYYYTAVERDFDRAEELSFVAEALKASRDVTACRILAAYELFYLENLPVARMVINQGLERVSQCPVVGLAKMEERLLFELRSALIEKEHVDLGRVESLFHERTDLV